MLFRSSKVLDNLDLIEYIANMKFTGSIKGLRDGEIVFSNEPVLTITAPLIQGKILETPILNVVYFRSARDEYHGELLVVLLRTPDEQVLVSSRPPVPRP